LPEDPSARRQPACRVVLVDDHPIVRAGLAALIDAEGDMAVCGQAGEIESGLDVIERERPDLVIVDLSLKGSNGLALIKELAGHQPKVLVASMHDEATYAERALAAGALGYVHKGEATREIVQAIRKVMAGRVYLSESISETLVRRAVGAGGRKETRPPSDRLSNRELEVFELIGKGRTTREIGETLRLSAKTVQSFRQRIKEKLGLETAAELSTEATRWVVESGAR
jgi:DNA-binding NarL/FixJ family response regulator